MKSLTEKRRRVEEEGLKYESTVTTHVEGYARTKGMTYEEAKEIQNKFPSQKRWSLNRSIRRKK